MCEAPEGGLSMSQTDRYMEYALAFDAAYLAQDWSQLLPYFADDARYCSYYGADIEANGPEKILKQFEADTEAFDRKFDERNMEFVAPPKEVGGRVESRWKMTYVKAGTPDLELYGTETATFNGDKLVLLEDAYSPETFRVFGEWLAKHGAFLREP
jgi:hypothetical protein